MINYQRLRFFLKYARNKRLITWLSYFWLPVDNRIRYKSLQDFIQKIPENFQKVAAIQPLILIGAFDEFDTNRRKLVENLPKLIEFSSVLQTDLFNDSTSGLTFSYTAYDDYSHAEKHQFELELMALR